MERIIFQPISVEVVDKPEENYIEIRIWGLNRDSRTILCRVVDFYASMYVEYPKVFSNKKIDWTEEKMREVMAEFKAISDGCNPFSTEFSKKKKLFYYTPDGDEYPVALLKFRTEHKMEAFKKVLRKSFILNRTKYRGLSFQIHEDKISIVRKLFTKVGIKYSSFISVEGILIPPNHEKRISKQGSEEYPITEIVVGYSSISPVESKGWLFPSPRILVFDLETYSDNHRKFPDALNSDHVIFNISIVFLQLGTPKESWKRMCLLLGDCDDPDKGEARRFETEEEMLSYFAEVINILDPDVVSGYNIFGFDNPYLNARWCQKKIEDAIPDMGRLIEEKTLHHQLSWKSSAYGKTDIHFFKMPGRITVDVYPLIRRNFKLSLYTLDFVSNFFLGHGKHDVKPKEMFVAYEESRDSLQSGVLEKINESKKKMKRIVDYCIEDSELVALLFIRLNLWISLVVDSSITGVTIMDLFTRGQTIRSQSLLYDKAYRRDIVIDSREKSDASYSGAYVFSPIASLYDFLICLDFASLYPSIIMALNICFTTLLKNASELCHSQKIKEEDFNRVEFDQEEIDSRKSEDGEEGENDFYVEEGKESFGDEKKEKKKKEVTIIKHYSYDWIKREVYRGILPEIEEELVSERRAVRKELEQVEKKIKEMEKSPDYELLSEEYASFKTTAAMMNSRQNGLKVTANSAYGFLGNVMKEGASTVTAYGRILIHKVETYLKEKGANIVYGDSVVASTPIILQFGDNTLVLSIEKAFNVLSSSSPEGENFSSFGRVAEKIDFCGKEIVFLSPESGIRTLSSQKKGVSFTPLISIIRHTTRKRIYEIVCDSGIVECTSDHSLLLSDGREISPESVTEGMELMTTNFPKELTLNEGVEYYPDFEGCDDVSLISPEELTQINIFLGRRKKYLYFYITPDYRVGCKVVDQKPRGVITSITLSSVEEKTVYDLETANHHFFVGPGNIIVHNTDSIMVTLPGVDATNCNKVGMDLAKEVSDFINQPPLRMEFEKAMRAIIFKKKKYASYLYSNSGELKREKNGSMTMLYRGIPLARRDNCSWIRDTYYALLINILNKGDILSSLSIIYSSIRKILSSEFSPKEVSVIKTLNDTYKTGCNSAMKVFGEELQRIGKPIAPGERLEYVVVVDSNGRKNTGQKMRLLEDYTDEFSENEKIDGLYYIEKLLQNPIDQLFYTGYLQQIEEMDVSSSLPRFYPLRTAKFKDIKKIRSLRTPVKLLVAAIKDYNKFTPSDLLEYPSVIDYTDEIIWKIKLNLT